MFLSVDGRSIGLQAISGLAVDPQDIIHVSDPVTISPAAVIKFDAEGFALISVDGNNNLYIYDPRGNHYHTVLTADGNIKDICLEPFDGVGFYAVVGSQAAQGNVIYPKKRGYTRSSLQGSPGPGILLKYEVQD